MVVASLDQSIRSARTHKGLGFPERVWAALLALGLPCWRARDDAGSRAAQGLAAAMLLDNVAAVAVLVFAGLGLKLPDTGLLPAVGSHVALTLWCGVCLRSTKTQSASKAQPKGWVHLASGNE